VGRKRKKLWSKTRRVRKAWGFEKKRGQYLTLPCHGFNPLDEENIRKILKMKTTVFTMHTCYPICKQSTHIMHRHRDSLTDPIPFF